VQPDAAGYRASMIDRRLLVHAVVGWALCGAVMAVGMQVSTVRRTLVAHAIAAPMISAAVTRSYLQGASRAGRGAAARLIGIVVGLDVVVVAGLIQRNPRMLLSPLATWIPLTSMLAAALWIADHDGRREDPVTGDRAGAAWSTRTPR